MNTYNLELWDTTKIEKVIDRITVSASSESKAFDMAFDKWYDSYPLNELRPNGYHTRYVIVGA